MLYFAYGSNMNQERLKERGVEFENPRSAILRDYILKFNKINSKVENAGYANIEASAGSIVEGILYEVTEDGLKSLDKYEGVGSGDYCRKEVEVFTKDNKPHLAITYIACPEKIRDNLKPTKEYLNHLLKGKNFLSFEYYEKLKNTGVI